MSNADAHSVPRYHATVTGPGQGVAELVSDVFWRVVPVVPLARTEATGSGVRSAEVMTCVRGLRGGWGSVRSLVHASVRTPAAASDAFIRASRLDSLNLKGIVGLFLVLTGKAVSVELPRLVPTQPYGRQTVRSSIQRCSVVGPWDM